MMTAQVKANKDAINKLTMAWKGTRRGSWGALSGLPGGACQLPSLSVLWLIYEEIPPGKKQEPELERLKPHWRADGQNGAGVILCRARCEPSPPGSSKGQARSRGPLVLASIGWHLGERAGPCRSTPLHDAPRCSVQLLRTRRRCKRALVHR